MLNFIIAVLGVLLTILLVVGVHEFGHFLMAKLSGVKVLRFSIGFGKSLLTWHDKSGTEYVIAAIPLGGYVKMLDESDESVPATEKHLAFNQQSIFKKILIIAAGPCFNLLFAFMIYWFLFVVGFTSVAPVIGKIIPHSIAEQAGLQPQQEILRIDDTETHSWMGVIVHLLSRAGDKNTLTLETRPLDTQLTKTTALNLTHWNMDSLRPDPLASIGIETYEPIIPNIIGNVLPDSPAAQAGLQKADKIIAINHQPVADWISVIEKFVKHPNETLRFTVIREGKQLELPVTIGATQSIFSKPRGYLGLTPAFEWPKNLLRQNHYGPLQAIAPAWQDVKMFTTMNLIVFGKMLTGKISLESLGGPITIMQSAGSALNNGFLPFLSFLAFLSISIGIINIIPIPGLDGGHLLFQLIECIMRRPLQPNTQLLFYRFGVIAIFLLMIQALVNDIMRL